MRQPFGKLLLFGATGDLSQRMLIPSLYGLHADGLLPQDLTITGTARSTLSDAEFRDFAAKALDTHLPEDRKDAGAIAAFLDRLQYQQLDASDLGGYAALAEKLGDISNGLAIFLSTAPKFFEPTIKGLASAGLAGSNVRIGLEKPLGTDLPTSREINDAVASVFPEERTFRIDHYLGKETVQNILALRFGNSLFEPIWNAAGIDHVQITVSETVGLEGRAGYYDEVGALRDMVQNHILQLLALIAMEPPARFDGTSIRDEKVKVLRSLRPIAGREAGDLTVTGQYTGGASTGKIVAGYAEELGKDSRAETFVAIKAHVDNWRWQGVPFYLRTGKRMTERRSEIVVQFKPVPHSIFAERGGVLQSNTLIIRIQPEEYVRLLVMAKEPGLDREGVRLREVPLNLSLEHEFAGTRRRIAYERLLLDLLEGDPTLFVRRDEVEAQWTWIDAIRAGWETADVKPKPYAAGTWGPSAAIALTERDGVTWNE
ncbi:glucose-6-phosphate dehydrogenase [Sphingomonas koreensis]|jgi:glucose-6-phosphate 1-dehydrogenase|uniref:Glucose-6-phosphate 1-dehydrogenase n=1 Tax=Sphingomonas koreensis TaxID=93064 RepID=A0A1L6JCE0_9SPHN|nr:glucose-6-phosphate dehydrogenase [Sphingomonas koreensis]APR53582.1 glucose-6-phosphate dehydrogenase [Sphingomonas koreensis]MDC7809691.1 glucose-6-phosphate dehydrogenase [Sphingomonas koreensis]RSU18880.1 glucose-6-phosphate dehydrogenase [Sphingomonas koreensis]RSU19535.1 glucose-6-phosphate dehydrogenase [Sphingomonas koreensis]RSU24286.1 glucose-6-phosphate dehydrogenase [Sphingomonas koreensis]